MNINELYERNVVRGSSSCYRFMERNYLSIHAQVLAKEMNIKDFKGGPFWCYCFMQRDRLSIRARTLMSQTLPADFQVKINCFREFIKKHVCESYAKYDTLACQSAVQALHDEAYSSNLSENENMGLTEKKQVEDDIQHSSDIEQKISVMEGQVESLLCSLQRLSTMEARLEELASRTNTEKKEGELITISRESWENLNGRILLLETKFELGHTKSSAPPPSELSAPFYSFASSSDASKGDIKDRLERIANMLKSTSTLMKSTDSPTTPYN
ncbi:centrosomal protein of 44 kDa isoform X7 [Syngnathus scovelli]|uniref:centrosomal protein of 44 kDa isoform X7 n=1 Tax=Syngnathus scovelli TaxID=161590 RepID=UPI00210F5FE3|nr:centrosomal protein of 44 kDa isoform X8 [Syngnathus scovelli]